MRFLSVFGCRATAFALLAAEIEGPLANRVPSDFWKSVLIMLTAGLIWTLGDLILHDLRSEPDEDVRALAERLAEVERLLIGCVRYSDCAGECTSDECIFNEAKRYIDAHPARHPQQT